MRQVRRGAGAQAPRGHRQAIAREGFPRHAPLLSVAVHAPRRVVRGDQPGGGVHHRSHRSVGRRGRREHRRRPGSGARRGATSQARTGRNLRTGEPTDGASIPGRSVGPRSGQDRGAATAGRHEGRGVHRPRAAVVRRRGEPVADVGGGTRVSPGWREDPVAPAARALAAPGHRAAIAPLVHATPRRERSGAVAVQAGERSHGGG